MPIILLLIAAMIVLIKYTDNTSLQLTTYQISDQKIPTEFHGYRIAQISDLHNAKFGENSAELVALLAENAPDIIVFTGDQIDARKLDMDLVLDFARQAVQIAPCYLVTGNHESSITQIRRFKTSLEAAGVIVLEDEVTELSRSGAVIDLIGLEEPNMTPNYYIYNCNEKDALDHTLMEMDRDRDRYSILIAHHPEYFYVYERNDIDLALCGHVHGGQIRLNGRGLIGPNKKLFPEYDAGIYTIKDATMVLSRGLGNSLFPWRINNPPEVVMVELISG